MQLYQSSVRLHAEDGLKKNDDNAGGIGQMQYATAADYHTCAGNYVSQSDRGREHAVELACVDAART